MIGSGLCGSGVQSDLWIALEHCVRRTAYRGEENRSIASDVSERGRFRMSLELSLETLNMPDPHRTLARYRNVVADVGDPVDLAAHGVARKLYTGLKAGD